MALENLAPINSNVYVHFCGDVIITTVIVAVTPAHFVLITIFWLHWSMTDGSEGTEIVYECVSVVRVLLLLVPFFFLGRTQARHINRNI